MIDFADGIDFYNGTASREREIANSFNKYYVSNIEELVTSIEKMENHEENAMDTDARLEQFNEICSKTIRNTIDKLPDKSSTKEGI